jgi:hypothetical protein
MDHLEPSFTIRFDLSQMLLELLDRARGACRRALENQRPHMLDKPIMYEHEISELSTRNVWLIPSDERSLTAMHNRSEV